MSDRKELKFSDIQQALENPFSKEDVSWRAGATTRDKKKAQALAYAEPRVYEDRLNEVCPDNWSVEFIPWGDSRIICNLTICGMQRSSTGEFDSEKRNAIAEGTVAEAQAFKRACSKFGLGRYLYDLPITWVEYDEEKSRLKETPEIPKKFLQKDVSKAKPLQIVEPAPTFEELPSASKPDGVKITLTKERADSMSKELEKLNYPKRDQLRLASSVLEKPVKDLMELTDEEAFEVWSYAKKVAKANAA